jgi:IS30 family transposase
MIFGLAKIGSTNIISGANMLAEILIIISDAIKRRRKLYGSYNRRGKLKNSVSIDENFVIVDTRKEYSDWEAVTIIGKGHLHTFVSLEPGISLDFPEKGQS